MANQGIDGGSASGDSLSSTDSSTGDTSGELQEPDDFEPAVRERTPDTEPIEPGPDGMDADPRNASEPSGTDGIGGEDPSGSMTPPSSEKTDGMSPDADAGGRIDAPESGTGSGSELSDETTQNQTLNGGTAGSTLDDTRSAAVPGAGGVADAPGTDSEVVGPTQESTPGPDLEQRGDMPEGMEAVDGTTPTQQAELTQDVVEDIEASTVAEARSQIAERTGLEPGQDIQVSRTGNQFQFSFTPEFQRELAASEFNQQLESASVDAGDIQRSDDGFTLTPAAQERVTEARVAEDLGLDAGDIELTEAGRVVPESDAAARELAEFQAGQSNRVTGVDVDELVPGVFRAEPAETSDATGEVDAPGTPVTIATPEGEALVSDLERYSGVRENIATAVLEEEQIEAGMAEREDLRETMAQFEDEQQAIREDAISEAETEAGIEARQDAREQIIEHLEEDSGIELSDEDVQLDVVSEDGDVFIRGELTESGQKRFRQEQAPGQGTPLEGVFEAGAGLQFEYEQATAPVEQTFNRVTPDVPTSDELFGVAAAAAPVAAVEPTPIGEAGVAGILAVGGALAAAEGIRRATPSGGVSATEVQIPDTAGGQFQDELEITGSTGQFVNELGIPDKQAQRTGPFGVPEQGITIDPDQNVAPWETDPEELPVEGDELFTTEMEVPVEDESPAILQTQQSLVREQVRGRRQGREEATGGTRDETTGVTVPERFIPDEEVTIGEESVGGTGFPSVPSRDSPGLQIGRGSGVQFVGRRARPDRNLTPAEQTFFSVSVLDAFEGSEVRESAEQASVSGDVSATMAAAGTEPLTGAVDGLAEDAGVGTDAGVDVGVGSDVATATDAVADAVGTQVGQSLASAQSISSVGAAFAESTAFVEANEFVNAYELEFGREAGRRAPSLDFDFNRGGDSRPRRERDIQEEQFIIPFADYGDVLGIDDSGRGRGSATGQSYGAGERTDEPIRFI